MRVIGLDCATDDCRIGVALGEYLNGNLLISDVEICSPKRSAVSTVARWLSGSTKALIAIDAPLGWPASLPRVLSGHQAGEALSATPNDMFRRETDRFIQRQLGKTPLDVGADRIARTAHAALDFLAKLRNVTGTAIPLAWSSDTLTSVAAIEVYPAATLVAHGFNSSGYKAPAHTDLRELISGQLTDVLTLPEDTSQMIGNADVLDAVVCVLAAKDFLEGRAMKPLDAALAAQEGWIWAASPAQSSVPIKPGRVAGTVRNLRSDRGPDSSGRTQDAVITNVDGLTVSDVIRKRVLCPACQKKVFSRWPGGWDAHVGSNCSGATGTDEESRKADFKKRFSHLFR